jgi:hypothetical protein
MLLGSVHALRKCSFWSRSVGTYRGELRAGYWLGTAIVLGAIVTIVHFLPTAHQESPAVIYGSWDGLEAVGVAAVANTFAIVVVLLLMAANAIRIELGTRRVA